MLEKYLEYIPIINNDFEYNSEKKITLIVRRNKLIEKIICYLFSRKRVFYINLDTLGSQVWKLIDGKRSIKDIASLLHESLIQDTEESIQYRTSYFCRYLLKCRFIKMKKKP